MVGGNGPLTAGIRILGLGADTIAGRSEVRAVATRAARWPRKTFSLVEGVTAVQAGGGKDNQLLRGVDKRAFDMVEVLDDVSLRNP